MPTTALPKPPRGRPEANEAWKHLGACRAEDPGMWDCDPASAGDPQAVATCLDACEVRDRCLAYALAYKERYGVWGGLCPAQRRRLAAESARTSTRRAA